MDALLARAHFLTRFLISWHHQIGVNHLSDIPQDDDRIRYLEAVRHFTEIDASNPQAMKQIALAQVQGPLEIFFVQPIDQELWSKMCLEYQLELSHPESLGEVGNQILKLLEELSIEGTEGDEFRLPDNWIDEPTRLSPEVKKIRLQLDETPREALRRYFSTIHKSGSDVLGGSELMVSMNEDVNEDIYRHIDENRRQYIDVYSPGSFDFQPVNRKDDAENIVVRLIDGDMQIEQIFLDLEDVEEAGGADEQHYR